MASWWNDYQNNSLIGQSLIPAARVSFDNGAGIDMKEAELGLFALLDVGAVSGTNPTLDVTLEESDDPGSGFTAINDFKTGNPAAFAQRTDSPANGIVALTFKRTKRFVRAKGTIGGTTPSFTYSVSIHGLLKAVRKFGDPAE